MNREGGSEADEPVPVIEGLRGVAAALVVYAHFWPLAGLNPGATIFAFTGVDLFFVLSGFVFAPYFYGRLLKVKPFLVRRFFRIYPIYALGVFTYALFHLGDAELGGLVLRHLLFLHTLESYEIAFALNPAFWSLPPELEFYLVLPLLVRFCSNDAGVLRLFVIALAARLIVSWYQPTSVGAVNLAIKLGFHLPGVLVEFLIGVGVWRLHQLSASALLRRALAAAGLALLCWAAWRYVGLGVAGVASHPFLRGNLGLLAALAYGGILTWVVAWRVDSACLLALCHWGGALSFGTYVFHNAAAHAASRILGQNLGPVVVVLALAITLLVAAFLQRTVEGPLRSFGRRLYPA